MGKKAVMVLDLETSFKKFCRKNKLEINKNQIEILKSLEKFIDPENKLINFFKKKEKKCFYLFGNIGIGKTMIANHMYEQLNIKKMRAHFNEFMINFHDFKHKKKNGNLMSEFVKNLKKKSDFIYLDEFQVTNIVDAMILGKLFELIFLENIKILITTNIRLPDLYKDGLQREQFIPFINLIKENSIQKELLLEDDYRRLGQNKNQRIFYPLNEKKLFKMNKNFRVLTKNLQKGERSINTKGRIFKINTFYDGLARFNFKELCDQNLGAEDYLNISKVCTHIFIDEVPMFNENNSNQQLRFITLIDILYEKKINLTLSMEAEIKNMGTSQKHSAIFKRTISRLYEMTLSKDS